MTARHALLAACALTLSLVQAAAAQAPKPGEGEEKDVVQMQAEKAEGDTKNRVYHLRKNVVFKHKDATFYCDEATIDKKQNTGKARGHLRIVDPDNTIVGDRVDVDFDDGRATITGNVTLIHKKGLNAPAQENAPEPGDGGNAQVSKKDAEGTPPSESDIEEAKRKKTVVTCDEMDFYYDENRAVLRKNVVAKQEDRTVYAELAEYDEDAEVLVCKGPTRITTEDGDDLTVAGLIVYYNEDSFVAEGLAGHVAREKKKEGAQQGQATEAEKPPADESAKPAPPEPKSTPPEPQAK